MAGKVDCYVRATGGVRDRGRSREILKLNPQTVRNWIDAGTLPAVRLGRRVRIKRSDFDAFVEAGYTSPGKPPVGIWDGDVPLADVRAEGGE
jgi:excisionase family DNA binding protein